MHTLHVGGARVAVRIHGGSGTDKLRTDRQRVRLAAATATRLPLPVFCCAMLCSAVPPQLDDGGSELNKQRREPACVGTRTRTHTHTRGGTAAPRDAHLTARRPSVSVSRPLTLSLALVCGCDS